MAAASATQMIAVWISIDMSKGIISRFRAMAIARSSVLAGHVYAGTILITVSIAALLGFALLPGYRPQADALDWLANRRCSRHDQSRASGTRSRADTIPLGLR
jgi:ABC-2 type transport system permease protein